MVAVPGPMAVSAELPLPGRSNVRESAADEPACFFRQPEVEDLDQVLTAFPIDDKKIRRLDIPMNDPFAVGRSQCGRGLLAEQNNLFRLKPLNSGPCQILLQGHATQQFHDQVGPAILLACVVNRTHIRVVQRGRRTRLTKKTLMRYTEEGVPGGVGVAGEGVALPVPTPR